MLPETARRRWSHQLLSVEPRPSATLEADPQNPQANVRLGYVLMDSNRCAEAVQRFTAAIAGHLPGADAHLGLAGCQVAAKNAASNAIDPAIP